MMEVAFFVLTNWFWKAVYDEKRKISKSIAHIMYIAIVGTFRYKTHGKIYVAVYLENKLFFSPIIFSFIALSMFLNIYEWNKEEVYLKFLLLSEFHLTLFACPNVCSSSSTCFGDKVKLTTVASPGGISTLTALGLNPLAWASKS